MWKHPDLKNKTTWAFILVQILLALLLSHQRDPDSSVDRNLHVPGKQKFVNTTEMDQEEPCTLVWF